MMAKALQRLMSLVVLDCLLAAKCLLMKATVIYNDFDGYTDRLIRMDDINRLRHTSWVHSQKLDAIAKEKVLNVIFGFDVFVDVQALPAWILFGGQQLSCLGGLKNDTLYNHIKTSLIAYCCLTHLIPYICTA